LLDVGDNTLSGTSTHQGRAAPRTVSNLGLTLTQWTFLLVLAAATLCFGATEAWSLLLLQSGIAVVLFVWIALAGRTARVRLSAATIPLLMFGCLVTAELLSGSTVYRTATQQELLKLASYFLCFFVAQQVFASHEQRKLPSDFLALFGGLLASFAIVQKLQGNRKIYWLRETSTSTFFGPYANKNHYAGLLEMLLPFALFAAARTEDRGKRLLAAFASAVMVASVFLSGSRSGIAITLFEVAIFVVLATRIRRRSTPTLISRSLAIVFAVVLVLWLGGDSLLNQAAVLRDPSSDASLIDRRLLTRDSLELVRQRPILGWGLGTFSTVYPQVASWYSDVLVNAAHNDDLQLLVETGAVGFALMMIFLALGLRAGLRRSSQAPIGVVSAAMLGMCALLLHSLTDFNLHVPANAAVFFTLCGLICAGEEAPMARRGKTE